MPTSGTSTCSNRFESNFRHGRIDLVFARWGEFKARLTWAEFGHLHLLRGEENLARIAHVSLAPERVFVGFPLHSNPRLKYGVG
jgi:hypothetical protein